MKFTTADAILDDLKALRARLARPAYDGSTFTEWTLGRIDLLDRITRKIEHDLDEQLAQQAEHYDSDPTPPHGIARPAFNTCVICGRPGAAWYAHLSEFVHYDCTRCNAEHQFPNPANIEHPYLYRCELAPEHDGEHQKSCHIRHGQEWTVRVVSWSSR